MSSNLKRASLKLVVDANVWGAQQAFSDIGDITILPSHEITFASLKDADVLITRSGTQVNAQLLEGTRVKFVGTATIGDDHVDKDYLAQQGIIFASAAGSSTISVVEYMLAIFFMLEQQGALDLSKDKLGIIGVGRIGSLLDKACGQIGFKTMLNDPPHQLKDSLDDVLAYADVLTLHTPLTYDGEYPTNQLIGKKELAQFQGKCIINAGRGQCVNNAALLAWLDDNSEHFAVLDCWENEPSVNMELLKHPRLLIATPHIAGHSLDGKAANTYFIYKDLCDFLDVPSSWDMQAALPAIQPNSLPENLSKMDLALSMYPIQHDSTAMKNAALKSNFTTWYSNYRRYYPVRRGWTKILTANNYDQDLFF
ncbi:MAG: 4-phosphoerythronate dehydrogenase [Ghiorsea sp.]